jgi:hypothetical protein
MRHVALCHTEMARDLAALQVAVSFALESLLGSSSNDTFCMEVVGKLVTEF